MLWAFSYFLSEDPYMTFLVAYGILSCGYDTIYVTSPLLMDI